MIEAQDLTKRYGDKVAVDHLTFRVEPGRVTGFLGPNGAGKSTTMRLVLGLDRPAAGRATINGRPYIQLAQPLRTVGALLEARSMHPGLEQRTDRAQRLGKLGVGPAVDRRAPRGGPVQAEHQPHRR